MRVEQVTWCADGTWRTGPPGEVADAQLALAFGETSILRDRRFLEAALAAYPCAHVVGCSAPAEISAGGVDDDALVLTAIAFERTELAAHKVALTAAGGSVQAGHLLGRALDPRGLTHVLLLTGGPHVEGSAVLRGLERGLPHGVSVTGGLSTGVGGQREPLVLLNGPAESDAVAVVGLYGDHLRVGCGSLGGWEAFGPPRRVTRARGNVIFELDGQPALQLYAAYLGEHAADLPRSALRFPIELRDASGQPRVIRAVLDVDEADQSLLLAGPVQEGSVGRLLSGSGDRLVGGAAGAARASSRALGGSATPGLALLVSSLQRRLALGERVGEEVKAVADVLGPGTVLSGFYAGAEFAPCPAAGPSQVQNQTMTITVFGEV